jgi:hypothetical protein
MTRWTVPNHASASESSVGSGGAGSTLKYQGGLL